MQKYLRLLDDKLRARNNIQPGDIRYAGLNIRVLANMLDMVILMVILTIAIMLFMPRPDFSNIYQKNPPEVTAAFDKLAAHQITPPQFKTIVAPYYTDAASKIISAFLLQIIISGVIFITCWHFWNATPGKMIFGLKIADGITLGMPTTSQYIIRFVGYILACIPLGLGFFIIPFTKRRRGLHDYMADTVVIYSRPFNPVAEKKKMKWQIAAVFLVVIISIIILSNRL